MKPLLDEKSTEVILQALKRGNTVELKRERDALVIVEIQRKVKIKTSATG